MLLSIIAFKSKTEVLPTRWRLEAIDASWDVGSSAASVELRFGACPTDNRLSSTGGSKHESAGLVDRLRAVSGVAPRALPRDFLAVAGVVTSGLSDTWPPAAAIAPRELSRGFLYVADIATTGPSDTRQDTSGVLPEKAQCDFLAATGVVAAGLSSAVCFADEARGFRFGTSVVLTMST